MRPATLAELAATAGIPVPEIRGYGSFTAFSDTYVAACQVLETPEQFRLVLRDARCELVRSSDQRRWTLTQTSCVPNAGAHDD